MRTARRRTATPRRARPRWQRISPRAGDGNQITNPAADKGSRERGSRDPLFSSTPLVEGISVRGSTIERAPSRRVPEGRETEPDVLGQVTATRNARSRDGGVRKKLAAPQNYVGGQHVHHALPRRLRCQSRN